MSNGCEWMNEWILLVVSCNTWLAKMGTGRVTRVPSRSIMFVRLKNRERNITGKNLNREKIVSSWLFISIWRRYSAKFRQLVCVLCWLMLSVVFLDWRSYRLDWFATTGTFLRKKRKKKLLDHMLESGVNQRARIINLESFDGVFCFNLFSVMSSIIAIVWVGSLLI